VAVDQAGEAVYSTNPKIAGDWVAVKVSTDPLTDVACPTVNRCFAVNGIGDVLSTYTPTGGRAGWTLTDVDGSNPIDRITCASSPCVAVDSVGNVLVDTYPQWTVQHVDGTTPINDVSCPKATHCMAVDAIGKVLTTTNVQGGAGTWKSTTVDAVSLTGISCPSTTLCMATDAAGNVAAAINPIGGVAAWRVSDADGSSGLRRVACPSTSLCVLVGGTRTLLATTQPASAAPDFSATYRYNSDGEISSTSSSQWANVEQLTLNPGGFTTSHSNSYSSTGRLTNATGTGTFAYDASGNPTGLNGGSLHPLTQTFTTTGEIETQSGGVTTASYSYDGLGDRTQMAVAGTASSTYGYDQSGHLLTVDVIGSGTTTYAYNGDGLRMSTTSTAGTQDFTWDVTTSTPRILSNGTLDFLYGPDGSVLEQENVATGANALFYSHDALGSTRELVNVTGTVVSRLVYGPYGLPTSQSTTNPPTPIGYAGGYADSSGFIYLVNRYYDPVTAQFLTVDPLVSQTGQPYAYAGDDPVNNVDPSGLYTYTYTWLLGSKPAGETSVSIFSWFSSHLEEMFPFTTGGCEVAYVGEQCVLSPTGPWKDPVEITGVGSTSFTFTALGGWIDPKGSTIRFSIYSKTGNLYLQQKASAPGTSWIVGSAAQYIWSQMAANLQEALVLFTMKTQKNILTSAQGSSGCDRILV